MFIGERRLKVMATGERRGGEREERRFSEAQKKVKEGLGIGGEEVRCAWAYRKW
jgi:hypothetical protein